MQDFLTRSSLVIAGTAGAIYHVAVIFALASVLS
jgi:hypothetical protein